MNNKTKKRPRVYIVTSEPISTVASEALANRIADVWAMGGHPVLTFVSHNLGVDRAAACAAELLTCDIAWFRHVPVTAFTVTEKSLAVVAIQNKSIFTTDDPAELAAKIAEFSAEPEPGAGPGPVPCPMDIPPLACFDLAAAGFAWTALIGGLEVRGHVG